MKQTDRNAALEWYKRKLAAWGSSWGLDGFEGTLRLVTSPRLRHAAATSRPAEGLIRISAATLSGARLALLETLCHEAAHIAAYRLYGNSVAPHGPEWQHLVRRAGFEPQIHSVRPRSAQARHGRSRRYEHRCPVCQTVRYGGRPVPQWHCAECLDSGLSGDLVISRLS